MDAEVKPSAHSLYMWWLNLLISAYSLYEAAWIWWRNRHERADERDMGPRISLQVNQEVMVNGRPCWVMRSKQNARLFMVVDMNGQGFWATSKTIEIQ